MNPVVGLRFVSQCVELIPEFPLSYIEIGSFNNFCKIYSINYYYSIITLYYQMEARVLISRQ